MCTIIRIGNYINVDKLCVLMLCVYVFKGHAAPVLYAAWAEAGSLQESELLNLRKIDSILEGHPVPVSKYIFRKFHNRQFLI